MSIRERRHRLPPAADIGARCVVFTACVADRRPLFRTAEPRRTLARMLIGWADMHGCDVLVFCFMPDHLHAMLYVGGSADIYASHATICRSTDGGKTWRNLTVMTPIPSGADGGPHEVGSVRVHPVTREAWAAGQCFGLWRIPAPSPGEKGVPALQASAARAATPLPLR